jgi:hypothetical protein
MATRNVTPIRHADAREEQLDLAYDLVLQAVRAAILLIDNDHQPGLAADVLRLARDRFDSVYEPGMRS